MKTTGSLVIVQCQLASITDRQIEATILLLFMIVIVIWDLWQWSTVNRQMPVFKESWLISSYVWKSPLYGGQFIQRTIHFMLLRQMWTKESRAIHLSGKTELFCGQFSRMHLESSSWCPVPSQPSQAKGGTQPEERLAPPPVYEGMLALPTCACTTGCRAAVTRQGASKEQHQVFQLTKQFHMRISSSNVPFPSFLSIFFNNRQNLCQCWKSTEPKIQNCYLTNNRPTQKS